VSRTPLGSFEGGLKSLTAPQLGSLAIKSVLEKAGIDGDQIDEVFMGNVLQAGLGQAPARQAALNAGISHSTPCTTVNKVCASGMKAIQIGYDSIIAGHNSVVLAGGQESISNVPFTISRYAPRYGGDVMKDLINHDGLTDSFTSLHMGTCAERIIARNGITREDQDAYSEQSYARAKSAWSRDLFKDEVSPIIVEKSEIYEDEEFCNSPEKFDSLRPLFERPEVGSVTFGNTSKLGDGAAATLLFSEEALKCHNIKPIARIVGHADAAMESIDFTTAVVLAIEKLFSKYKVSRDDISHYEINEAFASVVLVVEKIIGVDREIMNPDGGAISLGHPFGCSGARITSHLALRLKPGEYGIAGICNGGGGAGAILLQGI